MGCCFSEPIDFDSEVTLYHFDLHRAVGKGAFGKVRVVEHKRSKKLYALKYIDKARCIRQKAVANIIQERRLLEEVRSLVASHSFHSMPFNRLTTHLLSICATPSRMTKIVSLS